MKRVNNKTKYWRPATSFAFALTKQTDKHLFGPLNYLSKKLGVCAQATSREALMRGIEIMAKEAGEKLNEVVLTELGEVIEHRKISYQGDLKSQDKKVG